MIFAIRVYCNVIVKYILVLKMCANYRNKIVFYNHVYHCISFAGVKRHRVEVRRSIQIQTPKIIKAHAFFKTFLFKI